MRKPIPSSNGMIFDRSCVFSSLESGFLPRFPGTSCTSGRTSSILSHQEVANAMQIRQTAYDEETMRVLLQALVADLRKFKQLLDGEKRMLDGGTYFGLGLVLRLLHRSQGCIASAFFVREVLSLGRFRFDLLALPCIGRIAPHPGFIAVQEMFKHLAVMRVGRGDRRSSG